MQPPDGALQEGQTVSSDQPYEAAFSSGLHSLPLNHFGY